MRRGGDKPFRKGLRPSVVVVRFPKNTLKMKHIKETSAPKEITLTEDMRLLYIRGGVQEVYKTKNSLTKYVREVGSDGPVVRERIIY